MQHTESISALATVTRRPPRTGASAILERAESGVHMPTPGGPRVGTDHSRRLRDRVHGKGAPAVEAPARETLPRCLRHSARADSAREARPRAGHSYDPARGLAEPAMARMRTGSTWWTTIAAGSYQTSPSRASLSNRSASSLEIRLSATRPSDSLKPPTASARVRRTDMLAPYGPCGGGNGPGSSPWLRALHQCSRIRAGPRWPALGER